MDNRAIAPPVGSPSTLIDEDRIARVARALCAADGHDPETSIEVGGEMIDLGDGATWHREAEVPAWTSYAGEARRIIAAMVALGSWSRSQRDSCHLATR